LTVSLTPEDVARFERCIVEGGVAVFPTDTLYGLGCDPSSQAAVERMYALKGRRPDKPSAVMFFSLDTALEALADLGERTGAALEALLPGAVTVVVPNPLRRLPLAGGADGLGIRVPDLRGPLEPLAAARVTVLQTSANLTGGPDPRRIADVPEPIRSAAEVVLNAGPLEGRPSTVVDLTNYEAEGTWSLLREGAVGGSSVAASIAASSAGR